MSSTETESAVKKIYMDFPDMEITDHEINNFLRTPIDSRLGHRNLRAAPKITSPKVKPPVNRIKTNMGVQIHTVNFDWDSQIQKLSTKFSNKTRGQAGRTSKLRIRGLPDIAKREIIMENIKFGRVEEDYCVDPYPEEEETIVFPLRKNEIPNIRADPGILRPPKRKTRYD